MDDQAATNEDVAVDGSGSDGQQQETASTDEQQPTDDQQQANEQQPDAPPQETAAAEAQPEAPPAEGEQPAEPSEIVDELAEFPESIQDYLRSNGSEALRAYIKESESLKQFLRGFQGGAAAVGAVLHVVECVKKAQEPDGNWSEPLEAILAASADGLQVLQCWIAPECDTLASVGHAAKAFGAFCALVEMATRPKNKPKPTLPQVWEKVRDFVSECGELIPQVGDYLEEHGTLGELAGLVKQGKVVFDVVEAIHRYQTGEAGAPSQLDDLFIQLGTDVGPKVIGALFSAEFGEGVGRVAELLAKSGTQKLAAFMGEIRKGYQIAAEEEGTAARNDVEYQRQTEANAEQNGLTEDQAKQFNVLLNAVAGPTSSAYLRSLEQQDMTSLAHVVDEMTALRQGDLAMLSGVKFMYDQLSYQNIDRATRLSWLDSAGHAANACAQLLPNYQGSDEPMFSFLDALRIDLTTFCNGLQAGVRRR